MKGWPRSARSDRGASTVQIIMRWLPVALLGVALVALAWTRLIGISQSLWYDELNTLTRFASRGPSGIWSNSQYIPGDHILFMVLTWATMNVTGTRAEAILRLWSVAPAIVGGVTTTVWVWHRFDRWSAAIFAVLAASMPLYLDESIAARGYGLAILAGGLMLIGADRMLWSESPRGFWLFLSSALIGIWTLPNFVLPFAGVCAVLWVAKSQRARVRQAALIAGVLSLAFYAPVLPALVRSSGQQYGTLLPWHGFISAPLKDVLAPIALLLFPHLSLTGGAVVAGCLVVLCSLALWSAPERFLMALILIPTVLSYLVIELAGIRYAPRFASFVIIPLLVLLAAGLVAVGRACGRIGASQAVRAGLAIGGVGVVTVASALLLNKINSLATAEAEVPIENIRGAAQIVEGTGIHRVLAGPAYPFKFRWYLGRQVKFLSLAALPVAFCTEPAPMIYLEYLYGHPPRYANWANTGCLTRRGAVRVAMRQRLRDYLTVWIVPPGSRTLKPTPGLVATASGKSPAVVSASRPIGQVSTQVCGPSLVTGPPTVRSTSAPSLRQDLSPGFTVSVKLLGSRQLKNVPLVANGPPLSIPGARFAALELRVANLGRARIRAIDATIGFFVRDQQGRSWQLSAICRGVSLRYAIATGSSVSPNVILGPGQAATMVALYPVPLTARGLALESASGAEKPLHG